MGRTLKSSKQVFEEVSTMLADPNGTMMIKTPGGEMIRFTHQQKVAAVVELFCKGMKAHEIVKEMERRYGKAGKITRETTYEYISHEAQLGRFHYEPPPHLDYEGQLRLLFPALHSQVVNTSVAIDVVHRTADTLLNLVQKVAQTRDPETGIVHIGLAGGLTMRKLADRFADLLCRAPNNMPKRIMFHPLVSGFDPYDPTTDPNSFVSYYWNKPAMRVIPKFIGFRAPAIVTPDEYETIKETREVKEAFDEVPNVDIVVTSGSDCREHGAIRLWREFSADKSMWDDEDIGDILWRPISRKGSIKNNTEYRAMTLLEVEQLAGIVKDGKYVVLMTGPCGGCQTPKDRLLRIVLDQKPPLLTHLVADSRSVSGFLQRRAGK